VAWGIEVANRPGVHEPLEVGLRQAARDLGANAVVGIDLDYEVVGQSGGMLMVSISGTAVVVG